MSLVKQWFHRSAPPAAPPAPVAPAPVPPYVAPQAAEQPARRDAAANDDATVGRMLDTLGTLVQLVGQYAHDSDVRPAAAARHQADLWRRHLTTGLGHPMEDGAEGGATRGGGLAARDWEGAARFATAERQAEHAYVARALDDLRGTVWTLVQGLHQAMGAEAAAGRASASVARRLHAAVSDASPETLRDAALAAVGELGTVIAQREREREQQIAQLGEEISKLGAALEEARREGATDPLTGLGNRRAFDAALDHAAALHGLWGQRVCLLLIDVDLLKQLNDRDGHAAGDAALQRVASHLARIFMRRTDVVARIGGDEFAVLLRDVAPDEARRLAERLVAAVAPSPEAPSPEAPSPEAPSPDEETASITVSAGVAALRQDETAAEWFARADAALYAAKAAGRGRVHRDG
ncbi:GGDEF domain-containing protein [Roseisolibacter agri]|uniref:GGDEF domain-containing protein n=1 Tax=Roseisolibacter agri TaxID=2014610 RepID=UPI0024E08216|nr:GGDEF domain-containing protein [Roseisolibacter agri]